MKLSKAISGFLIHKTAEGLSPRTLDEYRRQLTLLVGHTGDPHVADLTTATLRRFLAWLRTDYHPQRFNSRASPLSPKTLRNYYIALRSFFTWSGAELDTPDLLATIQPPQLQRPAVEILTRDEINALLAACKRTAPARTAARQAYTMRRPTARRDQALVMFLLDTGIRASECCRLHVTDVDLETGVATIHAHNSGKKSKPRHIYLGKSTRRALWRYLADRDDNRPDAPLFTTIHGRPLTRDGLRHLCRGLGQRAGITKSVHPHRFRHTFALAYLRNGGDIFTLQSILGHASLDMVRRYLAIANTDCATAHRQASPVDNWRL